MNSTLARELVCPFTQAVMVDPVTASDGYAYERNALETYFRRTRAVRSLRTNRSMAKGPLKSNLTLRGVIMTFVDGAQQDLSAEDRRQYFAEMGKLLVAEENRLGQEYFRRAAALGCETSALAVELLSLRDRCEQLYRTSPEMFELCFESFQPFAPTMPPTFVGIGSLVRVNANQKRLKELCLQMAPGARSTVGWGCNTALVVGHVVEVVSFNLAQCSYLVKDEEQNVTVSLPYTACEDVASGGARRIQPARPPSTSPPVKVHQLCAGHATLETNFCPQGAFTTLFHVKAHVQRTCLLAHGRDLVYAPSSPVQYRLGDAITDAGALTSNEDRIPAGSTVQVIFPPE